LRKRLIVLAAGLLAIAMVAAGCGGGDDETTTASISKAAFIKRTNAICQKFDERIANGLAAYIAEHKDIEEPTEADYARLTSTVLVPNVEEELDEMRAVGLPSGDEDEVEEYFELIEQGIETAESEPIALAAEEEKVFGPAAELARSYGLANCGE